MYSCRLKAAGQELRHAVAAFAALLLLSSLGAFAQNTSTPPPGTTGAARSAVPAPPPNNNVAFDKLAKTWHSAASNHDFHVEVTKALFRADWVNIPSVAAKAGAHIHTECRRSGTKWVGTSSVAMLFGIPNAPAGKDTKLCPITVRFEVDLVSPDKITGHSEALRSFDVATCHVNETKWGEFSWVPKK